MTCRGIPLHSRIKEILSCIGDEWGKVIKVDCDFSSDLSRTRVLIDTRSLYPISTWIGLNIDGQMFDIHVSKDIEVNSVHVIDKPMDPRKSKTMEHEDTIATSTFNMGTHTCKIGNEASLTTRMKMDGG